MWIMIQMLWNKDTINDQIRLIAFLCGLHNIAINASRRIDWFPKFFHI